MSEPQKILNYRDFFEQIEQKGSVVSGHFDLSDSYKKFWDLRTEDIQFHNCKILSGHFAQSSFHNCNFDTVDFIKTDFDIVSFQVCSFRNCRMMNVKNHFDLIHCKMDDLSYLFFDENSVESFFYEDTDTPFVSKAKPDSAEEKRICDHIGKVLENIKNGKNEPDAWEKQVREDQALYEKHTASDKINI